jgi:PAS domain S-box-containing protein
MPRSRTASLPIGTATEKEKRRFIPPVTFLALGTTVVYELLKEMSLPGITRWQSHIMTIAYVTMGVTVLAWICERGAGQMRQEARKLAGWGQRSEAALRAFVDARPEPAFLVSRDHLIVTLNQALADRLGRSIDDVIGRNPFSLLPDRDLARARAEKIDEVFACGQSKIFYDSNNGRHYANHLSPVRGTDGKIWAVGVIAIDTTDLRHAEDEVRRKEELLRFGLEAARLGVWEWDFIGDVVIVSPEATRLLGAPSRARRGPLEWILGYVEPEDRFRFESAIRRCSQGMFSTARIVFRARPVKHRPVRWLEVQGRVFDSANGHHKMVGTVSDVTSQVEAEEKRQRSEQELERRVMERTAELRAANRELEAFSYSVSHDLRAPLRSIDGFALALVEDFGERLEPEARKYLEIVRGESQRMGQLIDDLLGLARLSRSAITLADVDVSAMAREIVDGLKQREPDRRVSVTIAPDLTCVADANLLRIALDNLIGNAWKFTSRTADARIEIGATESGEERAFHVRDNGAGFDGAEAGNLFQPFQRLHTAAEYEGTGIGLATVHRIIKRHRGRIWAESNRGEGAVFRWTLPGTRL